MEIIYLIGGFIALIVIWSFISNFLAMKKENRKKLDEYPQLTKELSNEKVLTQKHQNNYKKEAKKNENLQNLIKIKIDDLVKLNALLTNTQEKSEKDLSNEKLLKKRHQDNYKIEALKANELSSKILNKKEELQNSQDLNKFKTDTIEKLTTFLTNTHEELKKSKQENEELVFKLTEEIKAKDELKLKLDISDKERINENRTLNEVERERDNFKNGIKEQHELYIAIQSKSQNSVSKITSMYSDFLLLEYNIIAKRLENKKRPAIAESKRIKELKTQSKFHLEQYRQMLYKYEYLLNVFPELTNYVDDFDTLKQLDDANSIDDFKEDFDNVQNYLTKKEYFDLDENYRNQLVLDRYLKGRKTSWQVGRDYEMSCGVTYEEKGWEVEYFGMEKRLNDLGRDLIARKGNEVEIIQCKLWKKTKTIHEKHILQLYGTTIIDKLINPDLFNVITPVFITNTSLSETATKFAKILDVRIEKWEMKEFPRIKCNIGVNEDGIESKIYHLPFDQHYDRTRIKKGQGFLAKNIKEATEQGFRRSYKYYGR